MKTLKLNLCLVVMVLLMFSQAHAGAHRGKSVEQVSVLEKIDIKILSCMRDLIKHRIRTEDEAIELMSLIDRDLGRVPQKIFLNECKSMLSKLNDVGDVHVDYKAIGERSEISKKAIDLVLALKPNYYNCVTYGARMVIGALAGGGIGTVFGICKFKSGEIYVTQGVLAAGGHGIGAGVSLERWDISDGVLDYAGRQYGNFANSYVLEGGLIVGAVDAETSGSHDDGEGIFFGGGFFYLSQRGMTFRLFKIGNDFRHVDEFYAAFCPPEKTKYVEQKLIDMQRNW